MPSIKPLLPVVCLITASCAHLSKNARNSTEQRPQATDLATGAGNLGMGLFRSTAISTIRQPVTTATLGFSVLWHRPRELVSANLNVPLKLAPNPPPEERPGTAAFEQLLDRSNIPKAESGSIKWLVDGKRFFSDFDREMAAAKKSIDLQVYIYDNDDIAVRYADRLKAKSHQTSVRVMFDDMGSSFAQTSPPETPAPNGFFPPADMISYLEGGSNVRVRRTLNPWLVADHSKLILIDRRVAYIGGMNIGREYYNEWHDLMLRIEGPVVASFQRDFNRTWRKAGPSGDFGLLRAPAFIRHVPPVADGVPLRILRTDPAEGRYEILKATLMAINAASKRIWIENPYVAHDDITLALEEAARRGVDVRMILPARGDSTIMDVGNIAVARRLIQAGGKVFNYPMMTHMKVMICDDWACVGSANLDTLSMRINRELNISFRDPGQLKALIDSVFTPDFRRSRKRPLEETESPIAPIAEAIADQL
ncbi:MAG TPA: phosphatidylserine/phosphatidylglycerophosphate/cardiolipin synthase family protein [Luteolibacter sp.]|nr:phosphatidylserine/phosphatidylglycerophosphate/cardiolipin synthase family protein [Luteolibacter sp.]